MELTVSNRTVIRVVLIVAVVIVAGRLLAVLHTQLIWIGTALFLALALEPPVDRISRYMPWKSRGLAVFLVLLVAVGAVGFVLIELVPPFATQLYKLVTNLPGAYNDFNNTNPQLAAFVNSHINDEEVSNALQQFSHQLVSFGGSAVGVLSRVFGGAVATVTVMLLTFFMVLEGPTWIERFWRYQPEKRRKEWKALLSQMHGTVTGYVNGNLATSLIATVTATAALAVLGVPYALALGLLVGFVDLIPLVGATLAAIVVCVATLVFSGPTDAVVMAIYFVLYQQLENNVLVPLIFSRAIDVSPLVTLLALLVGVAIGGFIGALVSLPIAASAQIFAKYWLARKYPNIKPT